MIARIVSGACYLIASACTVAGTVPNDDCIDALPIEGEGVFAFDNADATTDGPEQIAHDVWYCWMASCDGDVTVDTCGGTTVDTKIAVYEGCQCPPGSPLTDPYWTDDACVYQSSTTFSAAPGQDYLIQIGTHPLYTSFPNGGTGTFTIACGEAPVPPCQQSLENCQLPDTFSALASDGSDFWVADDFTPGSDGWISEVCWWGTYFDGVGDCQGAATDAFEVIYYIDYGDIPGIWEAGPFLQTDGTLSVEGPTRTYALLAGIDREYEYTASHEPVSVVAGQRYWIEISNVLSGSCTWYWEVASTGNGRAMQDGDDAAPPDGYDPYDALPEDLAFCLNPPAGGSVTYCSAPVNDACVDSLPILTGDEIFFDTSGATTEGPEESCFPLGDHQVHRDVWFDYEAPCSGLLIASLCESLFDTKVAIYEGLDCPPATPPLACDDNGFGDDVAQQSQVALLVTQGDTYKIRVGGYDALPNCGSYDPDDPSGCADPACEAAVCAVDASCCDTSWDEPCVEIAYDLCRGRGGPGTITLELTAPPPFQHDLADYAEFSVCFTGVCADPPCDPPLYMADPCCLTEDFDHDGDVDLDDFAQFHEAWDGP